MFSEDAPGGENGEGESVQPPERSFWAKYVSDLCSNYTNVLFPTYSAKETLLIHFFSYSVDVLDPPWANCHECYYSSNEYA